MIDITKDDFLGQGYGEIERVDKKTNNADDNIEKNKIITVACSIFGFLAVINLFLTYVFFKIFVNL